MRSLLFTVAVLAVAGANPGCSCHPHTSTHDLSVGSDLSIATSTDGGCTTAAEDSTRGTHESTPRTRPGAAPPSTPSCPQVGDICSRHKGGCPAASPPPAGSMAGTCAAINTPCGVDGEVCNGCGGCCSS